MPTNQHRRQPVSLSCPPIDALHTVLRLHLSTFLAERERQGAAHTGDMDMHFEGD